MPYHGAPRRKPLLPPTKDLKHQIICQGVEALIEQKGLRAEDVVLWVDWQVRAGPPLA